MKSLGLIAAGILLLGALNAPRAESTYCEFRDLNQSLCSSSVLKITSVTKTSTGYSVHFHLAADLGDLANYYRIEAVLADAKIIDTKAMESNSEIKDAISRASAAFAAAENDLILNIQKLDNKESFLFYRLTFSSGVALKTSPWMVYQSNNVPQPQCWEGVCAPEAVVSQVSDDKWFLRMTFDQTNLGRYSVIVDDNSIYLPSLSCSDHISDLNNKNLVCIRNGNRITVMSFSAAQPKLLNAGNKSVELNAKPSWNSESQKLYALLGGISSVAKNILFANVMDSGVSIDALQDLYASIVLNYENISGVASANHTSNGILERNSGWLYPRIKISQTRQKTELVLSNLFKKQEVQYYYLGVNLGTNNISLLNKDDHLMPVKVDGGLRAFYRDANSIFYPISSNVNASASDEVAVDVSCNSDTFSNLVKNGLWIAIGNGFKNSSRRCDKGDLYLDGSFSAGYDLDAGTPFMTENTVFREGDYETTNMLSRDAMHYSGLNDTLSIQYAASRRLKYRSDYYGERSGAIEISSYLSKTFDASAAFMPSQGLNINIGAVGNKNSLSNLVLDLQTNGSDDALAIPLTVRGLRGIHYVVIGYSKQQSDAFITNSTEAAELVSNDILRNGEEPHLLYTMVANVAENGKKWYEGNQNADGSYRWGKSVDDILTCMTGEPYSVDTKDDCGAANSKAATSSGGISGVSYFGHSFPLKGSLIKTGGLKYSGGLWFGSDYSLIPGKDFENSIKSGNSKNFFLQQPYVFMADKDIDNVDYAALKKLFHSDAKFVSYACNSGVKTKNEGTSLVYRISNKLGVESQGDTTYIWNRNIIGLRPRIPNNASLKYYNITKAGYDRIAVLRNAGNESDDDLADGIIDGLKTHIDGQLKSSPFWEHVNLLTCNTIDETTLCDRYTPIHPAFLNVTDP